MHKYFNDVTYEHIYTFIMHDSITSVSCHKQSFSTDHCSRCNSIMCSNQWRNDNTLINCRHCQQQYCKSCLHKCKKVNCVQVCCTLCSIQCDSKHVYVPYMNI